MRLLGLDLSLRVGWSLWKGPADPCPLFGTERLASWDGPDDNDYARRTLALRYWLRDMIAVNKPDAIAFEAPWIPGAGFASADRKFVTNLRSLRLQLVLAGEAETTAKECKVSRILEVATAAAKVALAGSARLGKEKKSAMNAAAIRRGWRVAGAQGDQADAGAVCLVAYDFLEPR